MKKILFLIIFCFLLTGCTVNYNLEIDNESFKESITGNILNSELESDDNRTDINIYSYLINSEQNVFKNNDSILYNKNLNNVENGIDYSYSYEFNKNNFNNSRILNECFDKYEAYEEDGIYYISIFGNFNCSYADKTNINIKTNHNVLANNADSIKNNTYSWAIEKDNIKDLNLFITIDLNDTKSSSNWNGFKTFSLIVLLILSGFCIFIAKKKLNN